MNHTTINNLRGAAIPICVAVGLLLPPSAHKEMSDDWVAIDKKVEGVMTTIDPSAIPAHDQVQILNEEGPNGYMWVAYAWPATPIVVPDKNKNDSCIEVYSQISGVAYPYNINLLRQLFVINEGGMGSTSVYCQRPNNPGYQLVRMFISGKVYDD